MFYFRRHLKNTISNISRILATYLLIAALGLMIANQAVYLHMHIFEDGSIITHAHPYDKSGDSDPYKSHHHTNTELISFSQLGLLFILLITIGTLIRIGRGTKVFTFLPSKAIYYDIYIDEIRGPPIYQ